MTITTPEDVAALGEWLLALGSEIEKTPVGLEARLHELALATRERGWVIGKNSPVCPLAGQMLAKLLLADRTGPALVVRETAAVAQALESWWGGEYDRASLLRNITHDMKALEYTTGRPVLRVGEVDTMKDALDAASVGPMMAIEVPRFYSEVALPLAKHAAQVLPSITNEGQVDSSWHRWTIVYDWLLLRVLAHYTHDPTVTRWFQDELNPLVELGKALELGPEPTVAMLLWMVCGEDERLLSAHYPVWATKLHDTPQLTKAVFVDKRIPNLRLGLVRMLENYMSVRRTNTMYGRRSPLGESPQGLLRYAIMGSVNDILDVAMVSLLNMGSQHHWLMTEEASGYNHWLRSVIAGYTREEPMQWQHDLEQLAPLNGPLGTVSLQPRVVVE